METWGLGGVNNETKIAGLIIDFASVRAGLIQKSIISPAWTDNRFFHPQFSPDPNPNPNYIPNPIPNPKPNPDPKSYPNLKLFNE